MAHLQFGGTRCEKYMVHIKLLTVIHAEEYNEMCGILLGVMACSEKKSSANTLDPSLAQGQSVCGEVNIPQGSQLRFPAWNFFSFTCMDSHFENDFSCFPYYYYLSRYSAEAYYYYYLVLIGLCKLDCCINREKT